MVIHFLNTITAVLGLMVKGCTVSAPVLEHTNRANTRDSQNVYYNYNQIDRKVYGIEEYAEGNNYLLKQVHIEDYTMYGNNVSGRMRRITALELQRNGNSDYAKTFIYQGTQTKAQKTLTWNSYTIPYASEMYYIEITSVYGFTNVNMLLETYFNIETYANTQRTAYIEIVSTISNISTYLDLSISSNDQILDSKYFKNNNLYEKLEEIKLNEIGYQSNVKQEEYIPTQGSEEIEEQITYTYGKTNYYIIYLQPCYKVANTPQQTYKTSNINPFNNNGEWTPNTPDILTISGKLVIINGDIEVIDVGSVMFTILGMPFTFISTAFNLTLFPGTAYELNISYLFLAVIAVLIFVWILKLILNKAI